MASVRIVWCPAEDQCLEVEVECDDTLDAVEDITARAVHLFSEALAAVTATPEG